jgi:hypothetical protein
MPPPTQILAAIKSSASNASAVHIKGSAVDSGTSVALDLQLNKDGSASGTIAEAGTTIPLIVANKVYYVQFTKDLMSGNGIDPTGQAGALLLNKWVPSTSKMLSGTDMVSSLKPVLDYNALLSNMLNQAGTDTPKATGEDTVNGSAVEVYTMSDGTKVDVTKSTPHYLVRLVAPKSAGPAQLDAVIEEKAGGAGEPADLRGQRIRRQRTARDDPDFIRVERRDFFTADFDRGMARNGARDFCGEALAIDGESMTGRDTDAWRNLADEQRACAAQFLFQQPGRGVLLIGFERIAANQFGKIGGFMRGGLAVRAHFV